LTSVAQQQEIRAMLNNFPIVGWILDVFFKGSMAVPFWIVWTECAIGSAYFAFLPEQFHAIGFWDTVGIFICLGILKNFSPFVVTSTASADAEK
jgi:hypothetical protein